MMSEKEKENGRMRRTLMFLVLAACAPIAILARADEKNGNLEKAPVIGADAVEVRMEDPVLTRPRRR